ncbi:MAG TPA: hypothetical protein DCO83_03900 [Mucilaginibacter sp.]|nr:hypothetical protein [Mucilaginibacter sp.]
MGVFHAVAIHIHWEKRNAQCKYTRQTAADAVPAVKAFIRIKKKRHSAQYARKHVAHDGVIIVADGVFPVRAIAEHPGAKPHHHGKAKAEDTHRPANL